MWKYIFMMLLFIFCLYRIGDLIIYVNESTDFDIKFLNRHL